MSAKNEQNVTENEKLETKEVELEPVEVSNGEVDKKTKIVEVTKKVLKGVGIAAVGVIGYLFGYSKGKKTNDNSDSNFIEEEVISSDIEETQN